MVENYFEYKYGYWSEEGESIVRKEYQVGHEREMMRLVSKMICFSDCSDEVVTKIVMNGREVEYIGWRPGMYMAYRYTDNGEIAYENCFPQWDH